MNGVRCTPFVIQNMSTLEEAQPAPQVTQLLDGATWVGSTAAPSSETLSPVQAGQCAVPAEKPAHSEIQMLAPAPEAEAEVTVPGEADTSSNEIIEVPDQQRAQQPDERKEERCRACRIQ